MTKKLKSKADFYTKIPWLIKRGMKKKDLEKTLIEYEDVTMEDLETILKNNTLSTGVSTSIVSASNQKAIIYNTLDERFIEKHKNLVLFRRGENSVFYEYRHGVYILLSQQDMYDLVDCLMSELNLNEHRASSNKVKDTVKRISSLLSRTQNRYFRDETVEEQEWKLNLKNGLLDQNTWELTPHTPDFFSTVQVPYNYDPEAKIELFDKFIETVTERDKSIAVMLQEMFGYCIMDGNGKHKVFYLYGDIARNGKSTTAKLLCGLIGWGNVSTLSLAQLGGDKGSVLTSIVGKQINFSDEVSSRYIDSSRLTAMSAEGVIEIDQKFKDAYLHKVKSKFIIACNDLPQFKDSQGMKHRMISIPFNYHFPPEKRIEKYDEILLKAEGSAILNWAIEGAKKLKEQKVFTINEQSREDTNDNALQNNTVYAYLEMKYIFGTDYLEKFTIMDLYGRVGSNNDVATKYRQFCKEHGVFPVNSFNFGKELKRFSRETGKILECRNSSGRYYVGLMEKDKEEFNSVCKDFENNEI